jgi:hypothetical protein
MARKPIWLQGWAVDHSVNSVFDQQDPPPSPARHGKYFTPLNAARGPRAAHPVAALGRPISVSFLFFSFWFFFFSFFCFLFLFSLFLLFDIQT